jgi:alpha-tubulin suppressor-like RCC1 family protein
VLENGVDRGAWGKEDGVERGRSPTAKTLVCTGMLTAAVSIEGRVLTWGCSDTLGLGSMNDKELPQVVGGPLYNRFVKQIAGADGHMLALAEGRVYSWGQGQHGALGLGSTDNCLIPVPVDGLMAGTIVCVCVCVYVCVCVCAA